MRPSHQLGVALCILLCGCQQQQASQQDPQPTRWNAPSSTEVAADIAAIDAAALRGDQKAAQAGFLNATDNFRRSIKMADPGKPVDHELARVAAKRVDGVRSAVWLDRDNLFVIVDRNEQRSYQTIDAICLGLEPLGDTLGVVVNLQSGAATNGDELEILSRNCQLDPGDRAFLQRNRQVDVISPEIRAQQKANNQRQ